MIGRQRLTRSAWQQAAAAQYLQQVKHAPSNLNVPLCLGEFEPAWTDYAPQHVEPEFNQTPWPVLMLQAFARRHFILWGLQLCSTQSAI